MGVTIPSSLGGQCPKHWPPGCRGAIQIFATAALRRDDLALGGAML